MPCRATWGSPSVGGEAEGVRGKKAWTFSVVSVEEMGKMGEAGSGLASLNDFTGLWGTGTVPGCLSQVVLVQVDSGLESENPPEEVIEV